MCFKAFTEETHSATQQHANTASNKEIQSRFICDDYCNTALMKPSSLLTHLLLVRWSLLLTLLDVVLLSAADEPCLSLRLLSRLLDVFFSETPFTFDDPRLSPAVGCRDFPSSSSSSTSLSSEQPFCSFTVRYMRTVLPRETRFSTATTDDESSSLSEPSTTPLDDDFFPFSGRLSLVFEEFSGHGLDFFTERPCRCSTSDDERLRLSRSADKRRRLDVFLRCSDEERCWWSGEGERDDFEDLSSERVDWSLNIVTDSDWMSDNLGASDLTLTTARSVFSILLTVTPNDTTQGSPSLLYHIAGTHLSTPEGWKVELT